VPDDDGIADRGEIDHPKRAGRLAYANFPDAGSNRIHRFPIRGIMSLLDMPQLIACLRACEVWKISDAREAVAERYDGFHELRVSKQIHGCKAAD